MKQTDLIVLGLAGAAVWMILQSRKAPGGNPASGGPGTISGGSGTTEIFDARGLPFSNGWRYYSDGTSIGPDGSYYYGGQKIYSPSITP